MSIASTALSPASYALRDVAASDPNRAAIDIDGREVSYGELNEQADRLAHRVLELVGDGPGQVAYRTRGTHETAVAALAIQRAGLVGVPVDPTAPEERVQLILGDVDARLLISDVADDAGLAGDVPLIAPSDAATGPAEPVDRPRGELASIVYTSGSTGTPKGVMMGCAQIAALYEQLSETGWPLGARMGIMQAGSVGHAELPIGASVALGNTLVAYEIRRHLLAPMGDWLEASDLAVFGLPPTVMRFFLPSLSPERQLPGIGRVLLFMEPSTWADVAAIRKHMPQAEVINIFGQSETSSVAFHRIAPDHPIGEGPLPAGLPVPGIELLVTDASGAEVEPGEPGEIVVRGSSLALGYWRRPDLTNSNFTELSDGRREVRMGDAGRLRPDGVLEHLGRLDHVVKIYGNRVELGEVETAVARLPGVSQAAAASFAGDDGQTRIVVAIVSAPGEPTDPQLIRAALSRRLPGYMVPARIAYVDALPQLPNGKLDRLSIAELPDAEAHREQSVEPPVSELERQLAAVWCELLGRNSVGRHDDFFEIGGDSLKAGEMFVEIEERLGYDQPVSLLAEARTVAALAVMLTDPDNWEAPLAFHTSGDQVPLFVVHDGFGSLLYARPLLQYLGADQPVYGLRCAALNGQQFKESALVDLAAEYVERVRLLYPDGPVLLYGVSVGGTIAMEMARQLIELGIDVPLVVLGDTAAGIESREARRRRQRRELAQLGPLAQVQFLSELVIGKVRFQGERLQRVRAQRDLRRAEGAPNAVPAAQRGEWAMHAIGQLRFETGQHGPYPERVTLLRADGPGTRPDRGWACHLGSALEIVDVPGTHNELGTEASAAYVGPALATAIGTAW